MQKINFEKGFTVAHISIVVGIVILAGLIIGTIVMLKTDVSQQTPIVTGTPDPLAPSRKADNSSPLISMSAQNNSGLDAKYKITAVGNPATGISSQTRINLTVKNSPNGVSMPAHIHTGSCAKLGAVKYPLSSVVSGTSVTTIEASILQLKMALPLAINIHKSAAESGVYVACADLNADGSIDALYNSK